MPASKRLGGIGEGAVLEGDLLHHAAAALPGRQLLPQFVAAVDGADAAGAEQFVAGEYVEVAADGLHVHAAVRDALRAVDHHGGADALGHLRHLADGHDGAERIGDVGDRNDAGAWPEQALVGFEDEVAVIVHRGDADDGAGLPGGELPGHDVGVMLGLGEHDLVAGAQQAFAEGGGEQVDAFGGAAHEHDLVLRARIQEGGHAVACVLKGIAGHFRQRMGAAMDVGVLLRIVARHAVDHGLRLLRGGGAVEPDQRLAVHRALQDGEVAADSFDIEHACGHGRAGVLVHGRFPRVFALVRPGVKPEDDGRQREDERDQGECAGGLDLALDAG